jgi:hypothetical protein
MDTIDLSFSNLIRDVYWRLPMQDSSMAQRIESNLFFEHALYLVLFASSAGGV